MFTVEDRQTIRHIAAQRVQTAHVLCQASRAQQARLHQTRQELAARRHRLRATFTQWRRTLAACRWGQGQPSVAEVSALLTLLAQLTRLHL